MLRPDADSGRPRRNETTVRHALTERTRDVLPRATPTDVHLATTDWRPARLAQVDLWRGLHLALSVGVRRPDKRAGEDRVNDRRRGSAEHTRLLVEVCHNGEDRSATRRHAANS